MKNLLLMGALALTLKSYAQFPDSLSWQEQIDIVFEHVDLSEVNSGNGLLYQHAYPYYCVERYTGQLTDTFETSYSGFGLAYATLYGMSLDSSDRLPHPSAYRGVCDTVTATSSIIPLATIHQEYYTMDSLAVTDNLIAVSGNNLYDIPGRSRSPYIEQTCFMVAPARSTINGNTLSLVFIDSLIFNNSGKTIGNLAIDMDNGNGFVSTNLNIPITASYVESGRKHIKFKVDYTDGTTYYAYTNIKMEFGGSLTSLAFPYDTPDITHHLTATKGYADESGTMGYAGGTVYVSYACGHTSLQKPFIWAEGYNPIIPGISGLGLDYIDAVERIKELELDDKPLSQYLLDEGYDLVVLDYDDGADYLQRTAYFIEEAINWVNAQKHAAGSDEKNVIIGQSMGGMCSRYALRDMEINGEDHEVETYISFDSGHEGVNIPLGANILLREVAAMETFGGGGLQLRYFVAALDNAVDLADLPASRTMVKYQPWGVTSLYDTYYNEQNVILGMPQECEILAIANGSKKGSSGGQNFSSGDLILHSDENTLTLVSGFSGWEEEDTGSEVKNGPVFSWWAGLFSTIDVKVYAMSHAPIMSSPIVDISLGGMIYGVPVVGLNKYETNYTRPGIDAAPGGLIFPHTWSSLGMPESMEPTVYKLGGFCFTPTVSTLNYNDEDGDGYFFTNLYRSFLDPEDDYENNYVTDIGNYRANNENAVYETVSFKNTKHTFFHRRKCPFLALPHYRYRYVGWPVNIGQ